MRKIRCEINLDIRGESLQPRIVTEKSPFKWISYGKSISNMVVKFHRANSA